MSRARVNNLSDYLSSVDISIVGIKDSIDLGQLTSQELDDLKNATDPFTQYYNETRGDARYVLVSTVGMADGIATLDSSGKITFEQIPEAALGGLEFQGNWNADTNTPTLSSGTGTRGYFYKVSVAGSTNLDGITDWKIGDWAIFDGAAWQKIDQTEVITTVNGYIGDVVLNTDDINEGSTNLYFTAQRASDAAPVQTVFGRAGNITSQNGDYTASQVTYDNVSSGLVATESQAAIDEVHQNFVDHEADPDPHPQYTTTTEAANAAPVQSVNTQTGDVVLDTDDVNEGVTNQYFTQTRARNSISAGGDLSYDSVTGVISFDETYSTPSELLSAILTVDGATSGLDADLLDGIDSTGFSRYVSLNQDLNTVTTTGLCRIAGASVINQPSGANTNGSTLIHVNYDSNAAHQMYFEHNTGATYKRYKSGGVWSSWVRVYQDDYHPLSDDSDLLDGNDSSFYLNASNLNAGTLPALRFDDTSHGDRSGGSLHSDATPTVSGFMSSTDKSKVDNIESGAQVNTVDSVNGETGSVVLDTDDVNEGISNLYYTDTRTRNAISVTGDLSYNATTGVIDFSETYSTANELLSALTTVDGSGSGLDADTVDGIEGSNIMRLTTNQDVSGIKTFNGKIRVNSDSGGLSFIAFSGGATGNHYIHGPDSSGDNILNILRNGPSDYELRVNGVSTVWHTGNVGSGSGLDADLLDGNQGSYYLNFNNFTNLPDPTITLGGDLSGSVTLTDLGNGTLTATVADDSHNHIIGNVDGLQTALDGKLDTTAKAADSDLLDGQHGAFYQDASNLINGLLPSARFDDTSHGSRGGGTLHAIASPSVNGFMSSSDKTKLDGIESGAEVNTVDSVNGQSGAVVLDTDDINEGISNLYYTQTRFDNAFGAKSTSDLSEGTNLYFTDARAVNAIQNDPSWNATNWDTAYGWGDHSVAGYELQSNKGVAGGYASLDGGGKVPSTQLPSFVDDVEEYADQASFPATGESGKLYVALDTNKVYRWSGSAYIYITSGAVDSVNGQTGIVVLDTDDVSEGANLYYTQTRFDNAFSAKSTSDLSEGTNLYYTDARARNSISVSGDLSYDSGTGVISFSETYSTPTELLNAIITVDGSTSGLDADLLDGQEGSYYLDYNNFTNTPTFDNYGGWTLLTDGTSRGNIDSGENVNFVGGSNITLGYSATNNTITIDSSAAGGLSWSIISVDTTASVDNGYLVDCSGGPITLTLPASPTEGDTIGVADFTSNSETNNITLARNGSNIVGLAEDLIININGAGMTLVYTNTSIGWEIVSEVGAQNDLPFTWDANDNIETGNNVDVNGDLTINDVNVFNVVQTNSVTGSVTEDPNLGRHLKLTLTGDTTLSLTSLVNTTEALRVSVEVIQDGTGGHNLSFGGTNILFPGGTSPTNSTAANAKDIIEFLWNGTEYMLVNYIGDLK